MTVTNEEYFAAEVNFLFQKALDVRDYAAGFLSTI
jgi:hypothetical protein